MADHDHGRVVTVRYILFLLFITSVHGIRISNKTYIEIEGSAACFRRFNATHQIGCHSNPKGNVGVVHYMTSHEDFEWITSKGGQGPYAVLLTSENFTVDIVKELWNSGNVNGIMVIHVLENETLTPIPNEGFSPDQHCPNDQYGMYHGDSNYSNCKSTKWNPYGNNMMFMDFDFPIFILTNETEVTEILIKECFEKYNKPLPDGTPREYPLCAVELKDVMSGAVDSVTCLRRTQTHMNLNPPTYCDELGDQNVVGTLKHVSSDDHYPDKGVIIAAARMDSFSMFEDVYPSADNHVTGIVALLAAAEALGKSEVKDRIINTPNSSDILFTFLQGEAFDYIGSSRMVYEMEQGTFPASISDSNQLHLINQDHISHFVEVNQLGYRDSGSLWLHSDPISRRDQNISSEIDMMIKEIVNFGKDVNVSINAVNQAKPLPPASVQRFLMKKTLPAVVLTDHQNEYTNKYYNSRFDIARMIKAEVENQTDPYNYVTQAAADLTRVATVLARTLYKLSTKEDPPEGLKVEVDQMTVTHLLFCMLIDRRCELFKQVILSADVDSLLQSKTPYPFYVSVTTNTNEITSLTKKVLTYFTGYQMANVSKDECTVKEQSDKVFKYTWMQGPVVQDADHKSHRPGICVRSTVLTSIAKSPAFDIDGYDWNSGQYSTWTESSWQSAASVGVRIFLLPSKKMEMALLFTGVLILVLSLAVSYFLHKKSDILFLSSEIDATTTDHVSS